MGTGAETVSPVASVRQAVQFKHVVGVVAVVLLAAAPFGTGELRLLKLTAALYFAVLVISWDIVNYIGEISFGPALFFGIGGYSTAILFDQFGWEPYVTIPLAVLVAILAGFAVGIPALRLRGPYLGLVTLIAPLILIQVIILFGAVTGGTQGIIGIPSFSFDTTVNFYIAFTLFVVVLAFTLLVTRSSIGDVFTAIAQDQDAVAASGIDPTKFKVFAFTLSAMVGGLAGAMYVHSSVGTANTSQLLALAVSINVIIAGIIGGSRTITGAAFGGMVFWMLDDFLRSQRMVVWGDVTLGRLSTVFLMLLTVVVVFVLPMGVLPKLVEVGGLVHRRIERLAGRRRRGEEIG